MGQFCTSCDSKLMIQHGKKPQSIRNAKRQNRGIMASMIESTQTQVLTQNDNAPFSQESEIKCSTSTIMRCNSEMQFQDVNKYPDLSSDSRQLFAFTPFELQNKIQNGRNSCLNKNSIQSQELAKSVNRVRSSHLFDGKTYLNDNKIKNLGERPRSQTTTGASSPNSIFENNNQIFEEKMLFNPIRQKIDILMKQEVKNKLLNCSGQTQSVKENSNEKMQTLMQNEYYKELIFKMQILEEIQPQVFEEFKI